MKLGIKNQFIGSCGYTKPFQTLLSIYVISQFHINVKLNSASQENANNNIPDKTHSSVQWINCQNDIFLFLFCILFSNMVAKRKKLTYFWIEIGSNIRKKYNLTFQWWISRFHVSNIKESSKKFYCIQVHVKTKNWKVSSITF